jgi:XTP/dITP diphosphohydrolase
LTTLIFATNNANKLAEIQKAFEGKLQIVGLKQAGIDIEIEEPFDTLQENALEKCRVIYSITKQNCFGEDTGLFVAALNGEPGVKSARYAGEHRSDADNINLVLKGLEQAENRFAEFRTIIALIWNEKEYLFEGTCPGVITKEPSGSKGFGYDPVFIPEGSDITFAQMTMDEKSKFSHRKKAMFKLVEFLASQS